MNEWMNVMMWTARKRNAGAVDDQNFVKSRPYKKTQLSPPSKRTGGLTGTKQAFPYIACGYTGQSCNLDILDWPVRGAAERCGGQKRAELSGRGDAYGGCYSLGEMCSTCLQMLNNGIRIGVQSALQRSNLAHNPTLQQSQELESREESSTKGGGGGSCLLDSRRIYYILPCQASWYWNLLWVYFYWKILQHTMRRSLCT